MIRTPHTRVGTKEANLPQDIILEDNNNDILPEHCVFVVETNRVTAFSAPDACTFVDDVRITDSLEPTPLSDGMMIRFGNTYVFQFITAVPTVAFNCHRLSCELGFYLNACDDDICSAHFLLCSSYNIIRLTERGESK
mgnify:CR=1 FL=1